MRNLSPFLEDTHLFLSSPQTASVTTLTLLLSPFSNPSLELSSAKLHASSSHWWTGGVPLDNFLLLLAHPSVAETRNLPAWPEILGPPHRRELDEFCFGNFYSFFALRLQAAVKERQIRSRVPVSKPNKSLHGEKYKTAASDGAVCSVQRSMLALANHRLRAVGTSRAPQVTGTQ